MNDIKPSRKNPSRETCENMIKRILMTEVLEQGTNQHFKQASDFMNYFESLYPASDGLTKQVQRAIKSMNMPKDSHGYFIINKSHEQLEQETHLRHLLQEADATCTLFDEYETLLLKVRPSMISYLMNVIEESITFRDKYITMLPASNGILFLTENKTVLSTLLESLGVIV